MFDYKPAMMRSFSCGWWRLRHAVAALAWKNGSALDPVPWYWTRVAPLP